MGRAVLRKENIKYDGPGAIFVAPYGTPLPALTHSGGTKPKFTMIFAAPWRQVGTVKKGFSLSYSVKSEDQVVEDFNFPIDVSETGTEATAKFTLAEWSEDNIALALNGATVVEQGVAPNVVRRLSPPDVGASKRYAVAWVSTSDDELIVCHNTFNTGGFTGETSKSDMRQLECEFRLLQPDASVSAQPFDRYTPKAAAA